MSLFVIAKGLASFVLPAGFTNRGGGRTHSARYCYAVYLRHRAKLAEAGITGSPRTVAELGPGESVGTGLAAVIAGADRYVGLDVKEYAIRPDTLALFDEIAALFRAKAPIPGTGEFATIKPELPTDAFPAHAFDADLLAKALDPARLADLRARIATAGGDSPVRYAAPWNDGARVERASVDWIFSQAVMEHVDDLGATYNACREWLAQGGAMSHQIDLKSHGTAATWNGHWAYSDAIWRVIRGRRLYLINRQPASAHRDALRAAGFTIVAEQPVPRADGVARNRLAPRFRGVTEDDLKTSGLFLIARRADS